VSNEKKGRSELPLFAGGSERPAAPGTPI